MKSNWKIVLLLFFDTICISIAYILGLLLRFEFNVDSLQFIGYFSVYLNNWLWIGLIKLAVFWLMGLYKSLWRYASTEELVKIFFGCIIANAMAITFMELSRQTLPRSVYIMAGMFDILSIGGIRFIYRMVRNIKRPGKFNLYNGKKLKEISLGDLSGKEKRIMLVGAGDAGAAMIKELRQERSQRQRIVVAVDDNKNKHGQSIAGVKIAGDRSDIPHLCRKYFIDEIIIAIPTASKRAVKEILEECHKTKCKIKIVPALIDLINEKVSVKALRDVDIQDLLGRDPVQVNLKEISSYLEGKIVLVTGGGGSIGSELCRQVAKFNPRRLIALDIYENSVFELANELKDKFPHLEIEVAIGSIRDRIRMDEIFNKYKPHVVFHAAAHKHVPLMENNPKEAIVNNIMGTKNMIDLAEKYVADKFVLISTDKAVNPTNVMGATKRIAEMLLQEKSAASKTNFSAVRFGNVLGSNGSVIPTFRRQIAKGGPVTVTHPDITRYFMTIPEAVQLVIQAGAMATGGEIFILDMGEPVKIMDLAQNVIRLSGLEPYDDIDIEITGLRPGEKLYEELLMAEEGIKETTHNKIYVGHPVPPTPGLWDLLQTDGGLEAGISAVRTMSDQQTKEWLHKIVPNYVETSNGHS
jgi:FlaA1/EpsC-like NDP-sugar epimerase